MSCAAFFTENGNVILNVLCRQLFEFAFPELWNQLPIQGVEVLLSRRIFVMLHREDVPLPICGMVFKRSARSGMNAPPFANFLLLLRENRLRMIVGDVAECFIFPNTLDRAIIL